MRLKIWFNHGWTLIDTDFSYRGKEMDKVDRMDRRQARTNTDTPRLNQSGLTPAATVI